jgi:ribosomal protein S6
MTPYEMMVILRPDLSEDLVQQEVTKYQEFLAQYNTEELTIKVWGKRRLAYPIGKFQDGIYLLLMYRWQTFPSWKLASSEHSADLVFPKLLYWLDLYLVKPSLRF